MAACSLPPAAFAVRLMDLEVIPDGSVTPPGDQVNCTLYLLPTETDVVMEIRIFVVSGEQKQHVERVKALGPNRDPRGYFLFTHHVRPPKVAGEKLEQVAIAYQELDLPTGDHRIGYEVKIIGPEATIVKGTPLTIVTVTGKERTQMRQRELSFKESTRSHTRTARFSSADPSTGRLRLDERPVNFSTRDSIPVVTFQSVPASIPRGFLREVPRIDVTAREHKDGEWAGLTDQPWVPAASVLSERERVVHFATNRVALNMEQTSPAAKYFGPAPAETITYGSCIVNFPVLHHKKGQLESPDWWQPRDPEQHFLIQSLTQISPDDFAAALDADDVLVYVHGFNTTFEYAVLRTAQLQYDLDFAGAAVAFCWPSLGDLGKYQEDAAQVSGAAEKLAEVLRSLIYSTDESSPGTRRRIHIIAHSMGNRVLLNAIYLLHRDGHLPPDLKPWGQVVLAAPDVGATMFNNLLPYVVRSADRVTYYYCRHDFALATSQRTNYYEPVGLLPFFQQGIDTINADGTDTSFFGHGYYASSPKVLLDVQLMIQDDQKPNERMPPLESHTLIFGHDHWSFSPVSVEVKP
ncbi:MAG: alpha/beta hydrolase [Pirellulales bacterium]